MKIFNSKECLDYSLENQPESPFRISSSLKLLAENGFSFTIPVVANKESLLRAHSVEYIEDLKTSKFDDPECPAYPEIYYYAKVAAGSAIESMKNSLAGENSFSLMRPPGHHAGERVMGFCYLNNVAIAALEAKNMGIEKIAVLDIDYHHGNGTQEILFGREGFLHADIHIKNAWPRTGYSNNKNCLNFLVSKRVNEESYLETLESALDKILEFSPKLILVSAGFDTYKKDPVGGTNLEIESYEKIGRKIKELSKELNVSVCSVLEGGYSSDLDKCVLSYIRGFE
jgi:acetoin utilization deacetylase AcuC-like enzyme